MGYKDYQIEDFLSDADFKRWILNPTANSTRYWESVSANDPDLQDKIKQARQLILQMEFNYLEPDEEEATTVLQNILKGSKNKESGPDKNDRSFRNYIWLAACLAVILSTASVYYFLIPAKPDLSHHTVIRECPVGQRFQTYLPDGTKVWLNAESRIEYNIPFVDGERFVSATGEVYFDVAKDSLHPFIVESNFLRIVALGTSFNVLSRQGESEIISLVEGSVLVDTRAAIANEIVMKPGESVVYKREEATLSKGMIDESDISWVDGTLSFKDTRLNEVLHKLSRWYGVTFEIEGEFPVKTISGQYKAQSLENILITLGFTYDFEFEIKGKKVMLNLENSPM
ncbi:MAG: DUF4974 domain-containing protein [Cyclobacteriaceae bacterium]